MACKMHRSPFEPDDNSELLTTLPLRTDGLRELPDAGGLGGGVGRGLEG